MFRCKWCGLDFENEMEAKSHAVSCGIEFDSADGMLEYEKRLKEEDNGNGGG